MATLLPDGSLIGVETEITFEEQPTYTYYADPITKQIRGMTDGLEAMRQAVEIILNVERYKFSIFTDNAGVQFEGLIGEDYGFIISELKRRINDAFMPDVRITGTSNWVFIKKPEDNILEVSFVVHTVYGDTPETMEVPI